MNSDSSQIGKPISRLDGRLKVTGQARYAGDVQINHAAFAVIVGATIPAGEITALDTCAAEASPGVVKIFTHLNAPKFPLLDAGGVGHRHLPLQNAKITYEGQPIAVVVAGSFEQATYAATLVRTRYNPAPFETDFRRLLEEGISVQGHFPNDGQVGDVDAALAAAPVKIEQTYRTADRHHNPIEPAASVTEWHDGKLVQTGSMQGVVLARQVLAKALDLEVAAVQAKNEFVGGGFGCKGYIWPHQVLCAMAARELGRPVKLVLPRAQDFIAHGYQPATEQTIALGAESDGRLTGLRHTSVNPTPIEEDYVEGCVTASRPLYATPNMETHMRVVRVHRGTPTPMRAPHEGPGLVALEIAMDELAYKLDMDPLALRLKNHAEKDPSDGRPFSAKKLKECYEEGARRFGWSARNMTPRAMSEGRDLIGWGMATALMQTFRFPAQARASVDRSGRIMIEGSTQEIGTGTTTVMTQIAAEALGVPLDRVTLRWGDTDLPEAPITAGSSATLSFGSAVHDAASNLKNKLAALSEDGSLDPARYGELLARKQLETLSAEGAWAPSADSDPLGQPKNVAINSYGALFVEVRVDRDLMVPRVTRGVGVFNAGRIINAKTARSQMLGGFVWGLGQALMETSEMDHHFGRYVSKDLIGCHVPVHADIPQLDMSFIEEPDFESSVIGARGIGELGATGVAPAIANAVFHATGKRVRELPITLDTLLTA